jgi:hypothetical protein
MNQIKKIFILALILFPNLILAEDELGGVVKFFQDSLGVLNTLISILIAVALIVFFWGLVKLIASADNEESRTKGRHLMLWGIISLAVMISVWGLVNILLNWFGIDSGVGVSFPQSHPYYQISPTD